MVSYQVTFDLWMCWHILKLTKDIDVHGFFKCVTRDNYCKKYGSIIIMKVYLMFF
jgi:hypothetical protein